MKFHKLFHFLVLLALVACAPTLGPSSSTPTAEPTSAGALSAGPAPTITTPPPASTAASFETITPEFSSHPPSPISTPTSTATGAIFVPASQAQWGNRTKTTGCQAAGALPDPACTPGDIFPSVITAQVCVSGYSSSVRNVPASEKDAVYTEYGITSHATGQYEVDHFVSLELGGSNDTSNLWPEPANPTPGFHQKDQVENYLHGQVCKGAITLADAQRAISVNWLAVFASMSGGSAPPAASPTRVAITFTPAQPTATQAEQVALTATAAPTQATARARVGAQCKDGTSSTATGGGACSKHKGVQCWKYNDGTCTQP